MRTTREVLDDHLRCSEQMDVETDLQRNYAEDVVLITGAGVERGHDAARALAKLLADELPDATYTWVTREVEGDVAFLEWTAETDDVRVTDGVDTFVVRDGRIVAQTIHYSLEPRGPLRGNAG